MRRHTFPACLVASLVASLMASLVMALPLYALAEVVRVWNYEVFLDDKPIGSHRFAVIGDGADRRVESDASFRVRIMFIEAYRYKHRARERWKDDCLQGIDSTTQENGDRFRVEGSVRDGLLQLTTLKSGKTLNGCVMTFAYWNPAILRQSRLLNAQTGEHVPVRVESLGRKRLEVRGVDTETNRFALHAEKLRIDVWYAKDDEWVALETRTDTGSIVRYQLARPPQ